MSSNPVSQSLNAPVSIEVDKLGKAFRLYERQSHRLLQTLNFWGGKYYQEFKALDDVSFSVERGQAVGIIGKNGSGKSTLLQMICGTLHPTAGTVKTHGRVAALLELGAGFDPEFTGRENVYMNAALFGLSKEDVDERIEDILTFADIGNFVEQPVKTYSSGMFVRLAFAVIAHVDADILVIDEALAVGDSAFGQKCMRFLRRFRETGTILFVSHDTAAVTGLCDKAIWLDSGKLQASGPAKDVCEQYFGHIFGADAPREELGSSDILVPDNTEQEAAKRLTVAPSDWIDARQAWINTTSARNDIEVFAFDPSGADFGAGGAKIISVHLTDDGGKPYRWIVGGEKVQLSIQIDILQNLTSPIVGFFVKDRLGQTLFGDNTFLTSQMESVAGSDIGPSLGNTLAVTFSFPMPILPKGTYTVAVAVADGTQEDHVQHHWLHDALTFKSHTSHAAGGLVGIPMLDIRMVYQSTP